MSSYYDYLIIGGGITGTTAAETLRDNDLYGKIAIISDEPHPLYSRVLLPQYLKGLLAREKLFLKTIDQYTQKGIDLHLAKQVEAISPEQREIMLKGGNIFGFKKLLIASGGYPKSRHIATKPNIFTLRTIEDADKIKNSLPYIKAPIIVGSGFIALELIDILLTHKIKPRIIYKGPYPFYPIVDQLGGEMLNKHLEGLGVLIYPNQADLLIENQLQNTIMLSLNDGQKIGGDSVFVAVGIERQANFLQNSGIELGEEGIKTNPFLQTNQENIYAAGDVAEYFDEMLQVHHTNGNWTSAVVQGKCAAENMITKDKVKFNSPPTYTLNVLNLQITFVGACKTAAKAIPTETKTRFNPANKQYERFFIKDNRIIAAVLINSFKDKPHIAKLIEKQRVLDESIKSQLLNWEFDIKDIKF